MITYFPTPNPKTEKKKKKKEEQEKAAVSYPHSPPTPTPRPPLTPHHGLEHQQETNQPHEINGHIPNNKYSDNYLIIKYVNSD